MEHKNSFSRFHRKGVLFFTLIELFMVVAIIAILVSILLPSLSGSREKTKMAICLNNNKQIATAFFAYAAQNNSFFPATDGKIEFTDLLGMGKYDGRDLPYSIADDKKITDEQYASKIYYCPTASHNNFATAEDKWSVEYLIPGQGNYIGKYAGAYTRSYAVNGGIWDSSENSKSGIMREDLSWSAHLATITKPSETILLKENIHQNHILGRGKTNGPSAGNTTKWQHFYNSPNNIGLHGRHGRYNFSISSLSDGSAKNIDLRSTYTSDDDNMWDRD